MRIPSDQIRKYLVHLAIWLLYVFYESVILLIIDTVELNFWETGANFIIYAVIFYVNSLYLFPRVFNSRRYAYLVGTLALLGTALLLRYGLYLYVFPYFNSQLLHAFSSHKIFIAQSVWRGGYYTLVSLGYFFAVNSISLEKQRRVLLESKAERLRQLREADNALMQVEINNLKNQINPHFLYNALNFFYSQIYPHSEKTANGILLLSDIMRYALKEDSANGKVMLADEVKHLHNYICMNQLRFNNQLQIRFEVEGSVKYRMIMPLVLITFVENCFKHGDLHDPKHALVIRLEVSDDQLIFYTHNKKQHGIKARSTGIGLANTKRRLDLGYHEQYSLELKNETDFYTCKLVITL